MGVVGACGNFVVTIVWFFLKPFILVTMLNITHEIPIKLLELQSSYYMLPDLISHIKFHLASHDTHAVFLPDFLFCFQSLNSKNEFTSTNDPTASVKGIKSISTSVTKANLKGVYSLMGYTLYYRGNAINILATSTVYDQIKYRRESNSSCRNIFRKAFNADSLGYFKKQNKHHLQRYFIRFNHQPLHSVHRLNGR